MNWAAIRICFSVGAMLAGATSTTPTLAQTASVTAVPVREFVDENGVDLFIGQYRADSSEVRIGDAESGISYQRVISGGSYYDTLLGKISVSSATYTVTIDGKSEEFTATSSQGPFTPKEQRGNTLVTWGSDAYRYTTAMGASYMFDRPSVVFEFGNASGSVIQSVYSALEKEVEFFYDVTTYFTQDPFGQTVFKYGRRLAYVKTSTGYRINFTYQTDIVMGLTDTLPWSHVTKVVAYNELDPACVASASRCLAAGGWPSLTISPMGSATRSYTDSAGRTTTYTFGGRQGKLIGIRLPGSTTDDVTITYMTGTPDKVQTVTRAGVTTIATPIMATHAP